MTESDLTSTPGEPSHDDAAFFASVVAEVEQEAARRTEEGDYPRALLRRLDETFRRWIPEGGRSTGIDDAIRSIEAASYIDAGVPVESNRRAGTAVKTAVRKATYFYHRHMAQQIAALGIQITRPLRLLATTTRQLEQRIVALEDRVDLNVASRDELLAMLPDPLLDPPSYELISRHLAGVAGRILVGEVQGSGLVRHLVDAGLDAYGVGPTTDPHATLELSPEHLDEHLQRLEDGVLGGAVLVGAPDRLALNEQVRMIDSTVRRCGNDARVVVIATDPGHWGTRVGPVAADLTGSRPLHPATWRHLLERAGVSDTSISAGDDGIANIIVGTVRR